MEPMTREEIAEARTVFLSYIEAKETMVNCFAKLIDSLLATRLPADLLADWVKLLQVGKFVALKETLLDKRREEILEQMQLAVKGGQVPFVCFEDLKEENRA
jgi:hypothetical protein